MPGHHQPDRAILAQQVNGHPLVYLDNAATTQKPQAVIDAIPPHLGTLEGPALQLLDLPYQLDRDREIQR